MKIHVVSDNGELVETFSNIEDFDFGKPVARAVFLDEIREAIERGIELYEKGYHERRK